MEATLREDEIPMYAWAGRALVEAQNMETFLKHLIAVQRVLRGELGGTPALQEVYAKHDRQTMGKLLKEVRGYVQFDSRFEEKLVEALRQRNLLVHHYFRQLATKYNCEEAKTIAPAELKRIANVLSDITDKLMNLTITFAAAVGVTPDTINEELRKQGAGFAIDWTSD